MLPHKVHNPEILYDDRIQTGLIQRTDLGIKTALQFVFRQKGIRSQIYFLFMDMREINNFTQLPNRWILRVCPG